MRSFRGDRRGVRLCHREEKIRGPQQGKRFHTEKGRSFHHDRDLQRVSLALAVDFDPRRGRESLIGRGGRRKRAEGGLGRGIACLEGGGFRPAQPERRRPKAAIQSSIGMRCRRGRSVDIILFMVLGDVRLFEKLFFRRSTYQIVRLTAQDLGPCIRTFLNSPDQAFSTAC